MTGYNRGVFRSKGAKTYQPRATPRCHLHCGLVWRLVLDAIHLKHRLARALLLFLTIAAPASAELPEVIQQLPPIEAGLQPGWSPPAPAALAIPYGNAPTEFAPPPVTWPPLGTLPPPPPRLTEFKSSFFQKLSVTATEVIRDGSDGLGVFENAVWAAFAIPAPTTDCPLLLTPSLETAFLENAALYDVPTQLYAARLDFMWLPKLDDRWRAMLALSPGWYSDFEGHWQESFRLSGRAIARYEWTPDQLQFVFGMAYVNRRRYRAVPVAGLIWKPDDAWNCELLFPVPKVSHRISWGPDFVNWLYAAAEFGGNDWSIQRPLEQRERLTLRDVRLLCGWEQKRNGGANWRAEVGYVFCRRLELEAAGATYHLGDTWLVRGGITF